MRRRLLLPLVVAAGLALTGCGGSTTASSTTPPAVTPSGPSISASPSGDPVLQWCVAYQQITTALSQAPSTKEGAATSINALQTFDQLWAAGANLKYVTNDEAEANRRAIVAYAALVAKFGEGKKDTDQEVKDAQANLEKVTGADQALLQSSATKVSALCGPLTAEPLPSGVSPSPPSAPGPASASAPPSVIPPSFSVPPSGS
jgi:hypothetical protein